MTLKVGVADLVKGKTGSLEREHGSFHVVKAGPMGATLVDLFTFYPNSGSSRFCRLDSKAVDEEKQIYRARWSGQRDLDVRAIGDSEAVYEYK